MTAPEHVTCARSGCDRKPTESEWAEWTIAAECGVQVRLNHEAHPWVCPGCRTWHESIAHLERRLLVLEDAVNLAARRLPELRTEFERLRREELPVPRTTDERDDPEDVDREEGGE